MPFYSDGDGSTTFRVPSLKCWIKAANGTVSEVGSYLAAGLPNIYGNITSHLASDTWLGWDDGYGALNSEGATSNAFYESGHSKASGKYQMFFDASRSNSIYGNSTTVQPPSIAGMWLVKAYGVVEETGTIDEQQYIDDRIAAEVTRADGKYLPLSGGTLTGVVTTSSGNMLNGSGTDKQYWISGGTPYDKGAWLILNGVDRTVEPGAFQLLARNTSGGIKVFKGLADGSLTWDGHTIPTTDSLFTTVTLNVTGNISANNWGDLIGTFAFPNGYTKVVGILGIMVGSPGNMTLTGWELFGSNSIRVRCRSIAALENATARVDLMLAK